MTSLARLEIEREEETSTLFRGASLTTALMDLYMKSVCQDFLHTALFPTIHRQVFYCKFLKYLIFVNTYTILTKNGDVFGDTAFFSG